MILSIFGILKEYYPLLFKGLGVTLLLSAITVIGGAIIGSFICFLTMSKIKIVSFIGKAYVEVVRGVPLFLLLLLFYTSINIDNVKFDKIFPASLALIINSGAYVAEIIRAGIQSVDKGQYEASRSLGMSRIATMIKVIIPQAIKNIIPAIGNEYVTIIKETSLGATFYIGDLMTVQNMISRVDYDILGSYIVVAAFYFISTFSLSKLIGYIEREYKKR